MNIRSLFHPAPAVDHDWSDVVGRAAAAIRRGEFDLAEWLISEHGPATQRSPACLNLLAVIACAGRQWGHARRLWRRACRLDASYQPVRQNLRRYYELFEFGKSPAKLSLGDEPEFQRGAGKERS